MCVWLSTVCVFGVQLKRSFPVKSLGRGKTVMLRESFLNAEKEDVLGKALHDWAVEGCFGLIESMMGLEVALKRLVFAVCVITRVEGVPERWKDIDVGEDVEFDCLESFVKGYGAAERFADVGIAGFDRVVQVLDAVQRRLFLHCAAKSSGKAIALLCMRDIRDEEIVRSAEDDYSVVKSLVAVAEERRDVLYNGSSVMKVLRQVRGERGCDGQEQRDFSRLCAVLSGYIAMASPGGAEAVLFLEQYSQGDQELFLSYVSLVVQRDRMSVKEDLQRRCGKKNLWDAKDIMEWMWRYDLSEFDDFAIDNLFHVIMGRRVCWDGSLLRVEWLLLFFLFAQVLDRAGVHDAGSSTRFVSSSKNMGKACLSYCSSLSHSMQDDTMRKMCMDVFHAEEVRS